MLSSYEKWRRRCQWIASFAERQRAARQWIPLPEIADWCARSVTGASAAAEEQARALAYQRLDQSSRNGEFEREAFRGGRVTALSEIRYLNPELLRCRLVREQLAYVKSIRDLAEYCWLPRETVRQWLAAHGYPWPPHFDPPAGAAVSDEQFEANRALGRVTKIRPELQAAVETALKMLGMPGKEAPWGRFCDFVRKQCNVAETTRGYGDKSIERAVRAMPPIAADQDKPDIADMSDMSC